MDRRISGETTMSDKAKHARDGYAFSLGGMTSVTSFVFAPALDENRINRAWAERLRRRRQQREGQRDGNDRRNGWGPGSARDLHGNWA
jgi:hypothetical protein